MLENMMDTVRSFGPVFAGAWIVTIGCAVLRPQKYFNSILLMVTLLVTMLFVSGLLPHGAAGCFLLACFLLVTAALFLVPVLLIVNGIQMIRRESLCAAHVLSLALGIFVGAGEIAAVVYVLGLAQNGEPHPWMLLFIATIFYFSFLVLSFVLYSVFIQILPHRMDFNYVIIHGCGLADGERPTKLLSNRIDKAIRIYESCAVKPVIIPSGGQGDDEKLSEAQAMKEYLLCRGIPEEDIVCEDRSATTRENLINSKAVIDARPGRKKTALVSSSYHIYRCLRLAREVGLKCIGIGADVAFYYWPSALIREFIAVFLTKSFLIWSILGYLLFISPILLVMLAQ